MDEIKKCLLHLFKNDPENPYLLEHSMLLAEIGNELKQKGNTEEAALFYEKAISCTRVVPSDWYMVLGQCYLKNKLWKEAENTFSKILNQESGTAPCYAALAQSFKSQKKRYQEISSLEQATALDQNQPDWWYRLGELYEYFEKWDLAATAYDKAIALNGTNPQWLYRKGYALERCERKEEAQQSYEQALSLDGSQDCLRFGIGVFHQKRHYWPEAVEAYKQQLTLSPYDSALILRLATAYQHCCQWEDAITTYRSASSLCESSGEKAESLYKTGICLERLENMNGAAESYALALSTQYKAYWCYRLGYVLKELSKYKEACSAFQNQRRDLGLEASNAFRKKKSDSIQELCEEAIRTYREILSEDKTHPEYFFYLACWLELVEQPIEAIEMYKAALARSSEHRPEWWHRLGCALMRVNKYHTACEAFVNVEILRRPYALSRKAYYQNVSFKRRADYVEYHEHLPLSKHMILYESLTGNAMGGNPYAIFLYLLNSNQYKDYIHIWSLNSPEKIREKFKKYSNVIFIKRDSDAYLRYLNIATFVINDFIFPQYFIRKKDQFYLNTWHGSRIKSAAKENRANPLSFGNTQRNFLQATHMLSPNDVSTDFLMNSYDIIDCYSGKISETGFPRIDCTLNMSEKQKQNLKKELGIQEGKKIVLYAPTWRENGTRTDNINTSIDYIEEILETCHAFDEYIILFRPHQKLESRWKNTPLARIISQLIDTNELLAITDILITDYSSICFDFMATEKPIIFYIHDIDNYSKTRGLYFRPDSLIPEQCCYTKEELREKLLLIKQWKVTKNYLQCKNKFCSNDDGHAIERTIEYFFEKKTLPHNTQKIKILAYIGDFSKDSLSNSLFIDFCNKIDPKLYSLNILVKRDEVLQEDSRIQSMFLLPEHCKIIIDDGNINTTIEENLLKKNILSKNRNLNNYEKNIFKKIFKREYTRRFGDSNVDIFLDFSGCPSYYSALFGCSEKGNLIIFTYETSSNFIKNNLYSFSYIKENNIYNFLTAKDIKECISIINNIKQNKKTVNKYSSRSFLSRKNLSDLNIKNIAYPNEINLQFVQRDALKFMEHIINVWKHYNKYQYATQLAENIVTIFPNQNWVYQQLYFLYDTTSKKYRDLALECAVNALQNLNINHPYQEQKVVALRESGKFIEAIDIAKKALKRNNQEIWPYYQLALIYSEKNELDKAINYAQIIIKIQNDNKTVRNFLGNLLLKKGDIESAAKFAEDSLSLFSDLDWAYSILSIWHNKNNRKKEAIFYIRYAIKNQPENISYQKNLFDLLIQCGDKEEATSIAKKLTELHVKAGWPYIHLSRWYDTKGELDQAIIWRKKAIEIEPKTVWYREYLAELLRKKGNIDEVAQVARDALSLNPRLGWAYIQLSRWYDAQDKLNEAIACRKKAIEIHPDKLWYREYLFELLWKNNDKNGAAEVAREVIHLNPEIDWAYAKLSRWHEYCEVKNPPHDI